MPIQKTARAKKMQLKRELVLQYELPNIPCARWGTNKGFTRTDLLRGMLWTVFSKFIRKRDDGACISCNMRKTFFELQAGHFVPVQGSNVDLWFDEKNVNGECEKCNGFDSFHLVNMKINLILKYGTNVVKSLEKRRFAPMKVWTEQDYVTKIKHYYNEINK